MSFYMITVVMVVNVVVAYILDAFFQAPIHTRDTRDTRGT